MIEKNLKKYDFNGNYEFLDEVCKIKAITGDSRPIIVIAREFSKKQTRLNDFIKN